MIVSIAGLSNAPGNKGDLSSRVDRQAGFNIEATLGNRMDLCSMTIFDTIPPTLGIPDRAEVIVYDVPSGGAVVDPPNAISAYNTWLNGAGHEIWSSTPSAWTPRIFGGYAAKAIYSAADGPQRICQLSAQDYTYRLRTTLSNMAFGGGNSDQFIIQQLFAKYRSDFDVSTLVSLITASFPAISFPAHSLEQFLQRIIRVSRGFYRVDYYKRLIYGTVGLLTAPINFSDTPDFTSTFPTEGLTYEPDGTGLVNKVWVIGGIFLSATQTYQIPPAAITGANYQFALPGDPEAVGMTVSVGGVDQGHIGVAPGDGDPTSQASFKYNALIQHTPAVLLLRSTPGAGAAVIVVGKFRFPLIQTISDPVLIALTGGLIFEGVVRDRRINNLTLAQQVGKNFLIQQGKTLKGGSFVTKYKANPSTAQLLSPGQQMTIRNAVVYAGLLTGGGVVNTVIITKTQLKLTEDANQPFEMSIDYSDRSVGGGY